MILAGCGDNLTRIGPPLGAADQLQIVAHQDDDLLFMQPELSDGVARAAGVTNVYVTAGNARRGLGYAERRYAGLLEAYASIAGSDDWQCGTIEIAGHAAEHCLLEPAKLSLVFLGYPDGGMEGQTTASLRHLWEGKVHRARTVARVCADYDQASLISTLAEVIDTAAPRLVRTLEIAATHGRDHSDHMIAGALTMLAVAASHQRPELVSFRGYNTESEPANADPLLYARSENAMLRYDACADGCARCGEACKMLQPKYATYLARRYAEGMRQSAAGVLQLGGACLTADPSGGAAFGDCATGLVWRLDGIGNLTASDGRCLAVAPDGGLRVTASCGPEPSRTFAIDDEGHIWSGVPPAAEADMAFAHLWCLASVEGQPRAVLCGAPSAPTWRVMGATAATPRSTFGLTSTGQAVRLGGLGLCEVAGGILRCAALGADGALAPAAPITPLDVASFALGDVDGDHRDDACGADAAGIVCATAASGFHAARWTSQLANARDLSIVGGRVCGVTAGQLACARRDATALDVLAPVAATAADLDGDGVPDWCIAGPACGLAAERDITTAPVAWGHAFHGVIDTPSPDPGLGVFSDIDGDGRADLCTARDGALVCARSLAHGFGPTLPIAALPDGMVPTGVWAYGERICAGDARQVICTR